MICYTLNRFKIYWFPSKQSTLKKDRNQSPTLVYLHSFNFRFVVVSETMYDKKYSLYSLVINPSVNTQLAKYNIVEEQNKPQESLWSDLTRSPPPKPPPPLPLGPLHAHTTKIIIHIARAHSFLWQILPNSTGQFAKFCSSAWNFAIRGKL